MSGATTLHVKDSVDIDTSVAVLVDEDTPLASVVHNSAQRAEWSGGVAMTEVMAKAFVTQA